MLLTINGAIVDDASMRQQLVGPEFLLRDGIFETLRVYSGAAFKLEEHLARFRSSADRLHIALSVDIHELILREIARAVEAGLLDAFLRITLSRDGQASTVVTLIETLPPFDAGWYSNGIRVATASDRRNEFAEHAGIKTTTALSSILEFRAVKRSDTEDVFYLDTEGHVCEGSASNVFLYNDGVLVTPPLSCGVLPGITRATVLSIAGASGMDIADTREVAPALMHSAAEVFLTSSIREIVPVASVDGQPIGSGKPGPITRKLIDNYQRITRCQS